jgi:hypothetical protein
MTIFCDQENFDRYRDRNDGPDRPGKIAVIWIETWPGVASKFGPEQFQKLDLITSNHKAFIKALRFEVMNPGFWNFSGPSLGATPDHNSGQIIGFSTIVF